MNKIALVTGGHKGIGLGIAKALIDAGYKVALASRSKPEDPEVGEALELLGSDACYFSHDLQDIEHHCTLLDEVEKRFGSLSTLVSNAGVPAKVRGDMLDLQPDDFDFVLGVNLRGAFFLAQEAARRMLTMQEDVYRSITFVTSVSAEMVSIERAEYCMSKAGAAMMANLFAVRLAAHDIGVFELRPGIIETGMTAGVKDKYTDRIKGGLVPAARWGQPADIGSTVVPIAEGQLAFATGSTINMDGGLAIPRL
ncbi:MAG: 3-ketoacyl-ACP reductase [Stappiaceae bacterium]